MPVPRDFLICLLDYIKEQAKQINQPPYRLANAKSFQRLRGTLPDYRGPSSILGLLATMFGL
jgi:hypothetical protein